MTRDTSTYPLVDRPPQEVTNQARAGQQVRAIKTGEFRVVRRDEWFISGAIPEAYQALGDLSCRYHIARLVLVSTVTTEIVEELT